MYPKKKESATFRPYFESQTPRKVLVIKENLKGSVDV